MRRLRGVDGLIYDAVPRALLVHGLWPLSARSSSAVYVRDFEGSAVQIGQLSPAIGVGRSDDDLGLHHHGEIRTGDENGVAGAGADDERLKGTPAQAFAD